MLCLHCRTPNPEGVPACAECGLSFDPGNATLPLGARTSGEPSEVRSPRAWSDPATWGSEPGASQPLQPGAVLANRYEILAAIGDGGMGTVYRALDHELDRVVALKTIRPEFARNAQILGRFKQEIILARQVTHRNIIRIFDLGLDAGMRFITMECIEGEELSSILARRGKLPAGEAADIVCQVCRGLEAAHAEGVVHRDLKPQNIMLDRNGKVTVMDFGIARAAETSNLTRTGALLGTPAYMSPEQARGKQADARSDVYAAGAILYELLTGRPPFEAEDPMSVVLKRIHEEPLPPARLEPSVPAALNGVVMKMLATAPEDRYQSASEVLAQLEPMVEPSRLSGFRGAAGRRGPAYRLSHLVAAGLLLASLAAAGGFFLRHRPAPAPHETLTLLVADFRNGTGDGVFDGTLEPAFGLAMEGATFVSAYPRAEARRTAAQLRPGASRLDESLARLVALRQGIGVVAAGDIERNGGGYVIRVRALDPATGKTIASKEARAAGKEDVLKAVTKLAAPIRKALGDATPESAQLAAGETYSSSSLEAAQSYARGQDLQWSGKWDEAIRAYQRAVSIDPDMGRAYAGMAVAYTNMGQSSEGRSYMQLAMARIDRMSERERYRTYGAYYLALRNYAKAIEQYSQLIRRFPSDEAGRTNLALAYFFQGDIARAIEEGRRACEIYPKDMLARNNVALYEMYGGRFADAVRDAAEVLQAEPNYLKAYVATALSQLAQGNLAEAAATYRKLQAVNARGASYAALGLADLALYEGRSADAAAILEKAAAADLADGRQGPAAVKLAALAAARADRTRAIADAERALAAGTQESVAAPAARTLIAAGRQTRALAVAAELGRRLAPEPQCYARLLEGEAQLANGNAREALRFFQEAQKLLDNWQSRLDLARAHLKLGAFTEASSELDECIRRRGEATAVFMDEAPSYRYFPQVYYYLGQAREGLKSAGAAEAYQTFLDMKANADPGDAMVADARKRLKALK